MSILIDAARRIIVQGITGREAVSFTRDILDYGANVVRGDTPVYLRARRLLSWAQAQVRRVGEGE